MINLTKIYRFAHIVPLLLLLLAGACSSDDKGEPDPLPVKGEMELELDVSVIGSQYQSRLNASRALLPDDYELPTFPSEELEHLRVIIVDAANDSIVHNRGVLFQNGTPFDDNMKFRVECSRTFNVYLLGNCEDLGDDLNFGISKLPVGSIYPDGLIENAILSCTEAPLLINNLGEEKSDIPLTEKFTVTTEAYTGAIGQTQLEHMFVTRAASKFSFSIKTSDDFIEGSPALTSIRIDGLADKEYLLPRAEYNPPKSVISTNKYDGREIVDFSTPADISLSAYTFTLPAPLNLTRGMEAYTLNPELYFAESPLTADGLTCSLSFDSGETWLVPIKLPNLPYGLPRNTSAKVEITIGNNNSFRIQLTVLPWNTIVSEFDYADEVNIATDGTLSFLQGTYKNLDRDTARLVLLANQSPAVGTFGIATPVGMRWDAYLITEEGVTDAIQFQLPDGSTSTRISGIVGSESKAEIKIVPVFEPGEMPNTAILQVVVTTADGRGVPANILYGGGYATGLTNLTVIQNPK